MTKLTFKTSTSIFILSSLLTACSTQPQHNQQPQLTGQTVVADPVLTEQTIQLESIKANALFDRIFEENVMLSPVFQTYLGRSTNQDKWDDLSESFAQKRLAIAKSQLAQLNQINLKALDEQTNVSYLLLKQQISNQIEDFKWRFHHYPVNQMFGMHSQVPSLLINQHKISTIQDAENYIARINNTPLLFEQLILKLKTSESIGVIPPKFVFEHVLRDSGNLLIGKPFEPTHKRASVLLNDFKTKLVKANFTAQQQDKLTKSLNTALLSSLMPAYRSLISYLTQLEQNATEDAGIWKFPDGEDFYQVKLKRTTTTNLSAQQIHQIGLDEVKRLHQEMKIIKEAVNFDGDLNQFFEFMRTDKQFYLAQSEAGKQAYLTQTKALIEAMSLKLDTLFITKPKAKLTVKAVEAFREKSAGKAFYQRPSADGERPGLYYVNLYNMQNMPTYQMEALAYHEALPGHHMQIAITQELENLPKFRKFGGYTAYIEGWGLYSELLPKEIGFYQDPYSDFGRLAMELWRACRLVVDTGIHALKWDKAQAIQYLVDNTPNAENDSVRAIERYIVMPSQATAYKIGMLKILELRAKSKAALGTKFDIRQFHDQILKNGPLPLNVLEKQIDLWLEKQKS